MVKTKEVNLDIMKKRQENEPLTRLDHLNLFWKINRVGIAISLFLGSAVSIYLINISEKSSIFYLLGLATLFVFIFSAGFLGFHYIKDYREINEYKKK